MPFDWRRSGTWPRELLNPAGAWFLSRMLILAVVYSKAFGVDGEVNGLYPGWAHQLAHWTYPQGDVTWQYPPGAAVVFLAPKLFGFVSYGSAFGVVITLVDAAVTAALILGARRAGRSISGAWVWILGLPLMLHVSYVRFDVIVTALAVFSLLSIARHPWWSGTLAAAGALIKGWPVLTVLGAPRGRSTRAAWLSVMVSAAAMTGVLALVFDNTFGFLDNQEERGIEMGSLGGSVFLWWRMHGYTGHLNYQYGAMEFVGPYVHLVARASLVLTAAGFLWLLLWRFKAKRWTAATPADATMAALLVFVTTSRVISPQYFIWLLGLAAACLAFSRTTQRPVAALVLLATTLTTIDYPLFLGQLGGGQPFGIYVLLLRNAILVVATVLSCYLLWRETVSRADSAEPTPAA
ncbi:glycosyltransferase family 87 protein [Kitasatospora saccharophila]|uniref:Glycosyltransferase family 87 protein n=1 Tax=Kitasatospora saccharophila TaxID=407973 RepID=A0ABN2WND0_9ACTN